MNNEYIEQYSDINIEGVELYVKDTADGYAYLDKDFTKKIGYKKLEHTFKMNDVVVIDHGKSCRGISMEKIEDDIHFIYPEVSLALTDINGLKTYYSFENKFRC